MDNKRFMRNVRNGRIDQQAAREPALDDTPPSGIVQHMDGTYARVAYYERGGIRVDVPNHVGETLWAPGTFNEVPRPSWEEAQALRRWKHAGVTDADGKAWVVAFVSQGVCVCYDDANKKAYRHPDALTIVHQKYD